MYTYSLLVSYSIISHDIFLMKYPARTPLDAARAAGHLRVTRCLMDHAPPQATQRLGRNATGTRVMEVMNG